MEIKKETLKPNEVAAPTLFVGVGGTGCKIVKKVADLCAPKEKENINFLCLDTNVNDLSDVANGKSKIYWVQTSNTQTVGSYLDYDEEEEVQKGLYYHAVEKKDIDLVLVFGTSAGKMVKDMNLPIPMVNFSATDPVASGIIESSAGGSGRDNVWAQVEPSMPLRQLKYYHSIKPFDRLGIVVYGDETVSGVPDIEQASREVGFELVKYNLQEVNRETEEESEEYYKTVEQKFRELCTEDIDAFFLTVGLINDLERLPECLSVFYEKKIPVYVMDDTNTVKNGALLIISTYDFENVGYFIADAMAQILNGAVAGDLPCVYTSSPYICLNYDVAKQISYPLDIKFLMACDEIYTDRIN